MLLVVHSYLYQYIIIISEGCKNVRRYCRHNYDPRDPAPPGAGGQVYRLQDSYHHEK